MGRHRANAEFCQRWRGGRAPSAPTVPGSLVPKVTISRRSQGHGGSHGGRVSDGGTEVTEPADCGTHDRVSTADTGLAKWPAGLTPADTGTAQVGRSYTRYNFSTLVITVITSDPVILAEKLQRTVYKLLRKWIARIGVTIDEREREIFSENRHNAPVSVRYNCSPLSTRF